MHDYDAKPTKDTKDMTNGCDHECEALETHPKAIPWTIEDQILLAVMCFQM